MKRVDPYLICGAIILATISHVSANQEVPRAIASSLQWAESRNSRRAQAAEWLVEVSKIEAQIPTLSPAEEAWLKVE